MNTTYLNAVSRGEPHEIPATSPWRVAFDGDPKEYLIWGVLNGYDSELYFREVAR